MELIIALSAVILAVAFGVYALRNRGKANAGDDENVRIRLEGEYGMKIVELQKELQMLRQHTDSQIDEAKKALVSEREAKEKLASENSSLKADLQTAQSLLQQTKENAKKAETDREIEIN